jgi:hypothetical protein
MFCCMQVDGDRLDLSVDAAYKATQARHHPVPALSKQLGREEVNQGGYVGLVLAEPMHLLLG